MLINNAGILQTHVALTEVAPDVIDKHFHNDVTGSIMFTNAIFPMMTSSSEKRIIFMSSTMGSLTWNSPEGWGQPWPLGVYSVIKAALHMVARKYATELSEDGFTVVSLSPGWCKTELGTDYAPMYPEDSIRMVIPVIDSLAAKDNGRLVNYDGKDYDF
ncbi:hypothetical protein FRC03_012924 [Tulasnella sp. 419]|nr:hypothetical protein FRC03_012924 [Tulasnella sp. 419]